MFNGYFDGTIEFHTNPIYDSSGNLIREGNPGLIKQIDERYWEVYLKGAKCEHHPIGSSFKGIIRMMDYREGIIYLEQRVIPGDRFFSEVRDAKKSCDKYARFLSYDVFVKTANVNGNGITHVIPGKPYELRAFMVRDEKTPGMILANALHEVKNDVYEQYKDCIMRDNGRHKERQMRFHKH